MKKYYIATSIPYLNAAPHLGHALEMVQADVIARYHKIKGEDVFFLTGSDEHGAKIARAAEAAVAAPQAFVDGRVEFFMKLLKNLNISHDAFLRTSDRVRHWPSAKALWKKLAESGDIYKGSYEGLYCVGHEAFITKKDLDGKVCVLHKTEPEHVYEENYFFKLSRYATRIRKSIEDDEFKIFPESRKNEALHMLDDAGDVSFSRPSKDLSWGIPVPGDESQTMYVWCDALANYLSALGFGLPSGGDVLFKKYWPCDLHVIGKDILRFHAVLWPAMLLSAGLELPKGIFVHGFINVKGEKISKSIGNVIDPFPLFEHYGGDALRFYLIHEVSTFGDGDYIPEHFKNTYDALLVNGIGNLLSRVHKMISFFGVIEKPSDELLIRYPFRRNVGILDAKGHSVSIDETSVSAFVDQNLQETFTSMMDRYDVGGALRMLGQFLQRLDGYIEEYKVYALMKEKPDDGKIALWNVAYALAASAVLLRPFIPETAEKILVSLGVGRTSGGWSAFSAAETSHLFPRLEKK